MGIIWIERKGQRRQRQRYVDIGGETERQRETGIKRERQTGTEAARDKQA